MILCICPVILMGGLQPNSSLITSTTRSSSQIIKTSFPGLLHVLVLWEPTHTPTWSWLHSQEDHPLPKHRARMAPHLSLWQQTRLIRHDHTIGNRARSTETEVLVAVHFNSVVANPSLPSLIHIEGLVEVNVIMLYPMV